MSRYNMLVRVLDQIRSEAMNTKHKSKYLPPASNKVKVDQARARAFIHFFLKVSFGITDFIERERKVTDGTRDGGIDGYYIDKENRIIHLLQSKFRTTESNFEGKKISLDEILVMDIDRILGGEEQDEQGYNYNGKIKGLVREIRNIHDIGRYKYEITILANTNNLTDAKLRRLTGGYPATIFNFEACYTKLVFPVVSGTYFNASDIAITVDLSNKIAGSKISYNVKTVYDECEITVLFVPTIEIARIMDKYKNSILLYNPRSYLEFEGKRVNTEIRNTILWIKTNEFALLNNGITVLSDETHINEKIGEKNKAQLHLKNPQIINGGQTAYTLSRIFAENLDNNPEDIFDGKEVLLKIITLVRTENPIDDQHRTLDLIEQISIATNRQTAVTNADRHSNDSEHVTIQRALFDRYGILYERKKGEFGEGIKSGYIARTDVLDRNLFLRIYLAANGELKLSGKKKIFPNFDFSTLNVTNIKQMDRFYFGFLCYGLLHGEQTLGVRRQKDIFGKIYAIVLKYAPNDVLALEIQDIEIIISKLNNDWDVFIREVGKKRNNKKFIKTYTDKKTGDQLSRFSTERWMNSQEFDIDIKRVFGR